ncbi:MAG: hypothetical protein D4R65_11180 [Verrucomicrobiaceae bacterium]|nr:MAG: hypothetical protein D4R65_11180 [Verrucomicrobiaceae bacterium]
MDQSRPAFTPAFPVPMRQMFFPPMDGWASFASDMVGHECGSGGKKGKESNPKDTAHFSVRHSLARL